MGESDKIVYNKLYGRVIPLSQAEAIYYDKVLKAYEQNKPEEDELVSLLISDGILSRDEAYSKTYDSVNKALQGEILSSETSDLFPFFTQSQAAVSIMHQKASIFDVSKLYVELRDKKTKANDEPETEESQQTETFINSFNRILNESYLAQPHYKSAIADAIKFSRGYPMAVTLLGWDDNATLGSADLPTGDITCETVPIDAFFWDPSVVSIDDAEYCFVAKTLPFRTVENFISQISKDSSKIELLRAVYLNGSNTNNATKGLSAIKDNTQLVTKGALELITLYKKRFNNHGKVVGIDLIYAIDRGNYVLARRQLKTTMLPFAILKEHNMPSSFAGVSSVMLALPYLRQKLLLDGTISNIMLNLKSPTYIVSQQSGIDAQTFIDITSDGANKSVYTNSEVSNSIALAPQPNINSDMITYRNNLDIEINKTINASAVNDFGSKLSGAAVQSVIQQATMAENTDIIELEKYLVRFIKIMLEFFKHYVPTKDKNKGLIFRAKNNQSLRRTKEDKDYQILEITPDEFANLEADIIIDASLLRVSKQQKQQEDLLKLLQFEMQYQGKADLVTIADIVETLNLPNKAQVVDRIIEQSEQAQMQKTVQAIDLFTQLLQSQQAQELPQEEVAMIVAQAVENPELLATIQENLQKEQQAKEQQAKQQGGNI